LAILAALLIGIESPAVTLRSYADQLPVRFTEGLQQGFLVLRTQDGRQIADGETTQIAKEGAVTTHLMFRFFGQLSSSWRVEEIEF